MTEQAARQATQHAQHAADNMRAVSGSLPSDAPEGARARELVAEIEALAKTIRALVVEEKLADG